jgi:hypothetical protein
LVKEWDKKSHRNGRISAISTLCAFATGVPGSLVAYYYFMNPSSSQYDGSLAASGAVLLVASVLAAEVAHVYHKNTNDLESKIDGELFRPFRLLPH